MSAKVLRGKELITHVERIEIEIKVKKNNLNLDLDLDLVMFSDVIKV